MIQKPRGTQDLYEDKSRIITTLKYLICNLMSNYNYKEIITPTFESKELFSSSVGDETDIVSKEMFEFKDRKDREMVLRPELTAPVARSVIENKLYANINPLKLFYFDKCYRYERPQKGRQREFYQFGVELIGTDSYFAEIEALQIIVNLLNILQIDQYQIRVNYLLTDKSRDQYISKLREYLKTLKLCDDCNVRIIKNPLRVLDCKIDNKLFVDAPKMYDFLSSDELDNFNNILKNLENVNIKTTRDDNLVRGLDYYTGLIFELDLKLNDGTYITACGGGRYDNLYEKLGGPKLGCVGFACGVERVLLYIEEHKLNILQDESIDIYFIGVTEKARSFSNLIANYLRMSGVSCEINLENKSLKSSFKYSEQINASNIIVIGEDELKSNLFKIKNQKSKKEIEIKGIDELVKYFTNKEGE